MARKVLDIETYGRHRCIHCGEWLDENQFYKSANELYKAVGLLLICKSCISDEFDYLLQTYSNNDRNALYRLCAKLNIPFYHKVYEGAASTSQKKNMRIYSAYFSKLNSFGEANNYGTAFIDGEVLDEVKGDIKGSSSEQRKATETNIEELEKNIEFTAQDQQVKDDVIRLVGYEVFSGHSLPDQKFLYNELLPYLDEDTIDDTFKLSQIIQLVNNNNQIRKLDLMINNLSLLSNQNEIKSLTDIKNKIVSSTDKIAKENSISVKNRGDKSAGKSTLTYLMKNYRELGFEDAEQDYYDQNKAQGMKMVADISHRSILEQLQLDENDYNDMLLSQRQLLQELQTKLANVEEENRQLYVKLGNQEINSE